MKTRAKVISVCSQKGGVGKTTTALALSASFVLAGKSTLVIDIDPNAHISAILSKDSAQYTKTSADLLMKKFYSHNIIISQAMPVHYIPGGDGLVQYEKKDPFFKKSWYGRLRKKISRFDYDYIIIDTPTTIGSLLYTAVCASDLTVIPVQPELSSLKGLGLFLKTAKSLKKYMPDGFDYTILFTNVVYTPERKTAIDSFFKSKIGKKCSTEIIEHDCAFIDELFSCNPDTGRLSSSVTFQKYNKVSERFFI